MDFNMNVKNKFNQSLSTKRLTLICLASIISIRSLPMMASMGMQLFFFYLAATVLYLIPSAFVYAELAGGWPQAGGIYAWSKIAFGEKAAVFATWTEWFNNIIGTPTSLSFLATAIAYITIPALGTNKIFVFCTMLGILWGVIFINFLAIKKSTILNVLGAWIGILLPVSFMVILGIIWLFTNHTSQIAFNFADIVPSLNAKNFAFLLGVFSSYAGMQILGFHVKNIKHPAHDVPRAMVQSISLIVGVTVLGALAISIVVPHNKLSLVSGVFEGFKIFLTQFHIGWALDAIIFALIIGGLSMTSAWLIGPARGLAAAAQEGLFPRWLGKENKFDMPINVLLLQAVIGSIISTLFLFAPTLSAAFWMLMVLSSQFTLVLDILIFAAVIKLRYSAPKAARTFKVPGGNFGVWLIAGFSILACVAAIILGFFPPANLNVGSVLRFETILIVGNIGYIAVPLLIYAYNKKCRRGVSSARMPLP